MHRPFELSFFVTAVLGVSSLLLWAFVTWGASSLLIHSIDSTLGVEGILDAGAARARPAENGRPVDLFDQGCLSEGSLTFDGVETALRDAGADPEAPTAAVFRALCSTLAGYRNVALTGKKEEAFPMILPYSETAATAPAPPAETAASAEGKDPNAPPSIQVQARLLSTCSERLKGEDLGWYPIACLLERIHGVGRLYSLDSSRFARFLSLIVLPDSSRSGLQDNAYAFPHSRAVAYDQPPNKVRWRRSKRNPSNPDARAIQIQTLQVALNRLDKLLLPRVKELEQAVWGRRFVLRALNHPFQFVMFWLGLWAASLYATQWYRARWGRDSAPKLARWIADHAPCGKASSAFTTTKTLPSDPPAPKQPYSGELRNVVDQLSTNASVRGRALADTITEWIPMLGFIGTVFGMIGAMDAIGAVIAADQGPELYVAMGGVTSKLSLAFYTTFVGLVVGLGLSYLHRSVLAGELAAMNKAVQIVRQ